MKRQGLAKSSFHEAHESLPWNGSEEKYKGHHWPLLELLLSQKRLSYFDYALADRLLRDHPSAGQEVALFLCHLSLAAKDGHLCIRIINDEVIPPITQIWQDDEGESPAPDLEEKLTEMIITGSKEIPVAIQTAIDQESTTVPRTPLCRKGNDFYLQRHWIFESLFIKHLKKHLKTPPALSIDQDKVVNTVEEMVQKGVLLKEQGRAIKMGCLNTLTLVTGGPGTGKTYTAGHLIRVFWESLPEEERRSCQVVLAAPTGKAAANLQRSLSRVAASLTGFPAIQAKTLHALLNIRQSGEQQEVERLAADLLIVDESSMIDLKMIALLFESLKPGSRLILLGDRHQLPSVEAGSVFIDLIRLHEASLPHLNIPCASLLVCLRAELKALIDFASLVNQGVPRCVLDSLSEQREEGIRRLHFSTERNHAQKEFVAHVLPYFPSVLKHNQQPEDLLDLFQTIRLLSPMRKGPFGVEILNELIWDKISKSSPSSGWIAIPIMISVNDYRQELFNGETGVLVRRLPLHAMSEDDYALFPPQKEGEKARRLPALLLPKYELAYCLSVHKSQGSEFDRVILVLPDGAEKFGREVFYTGITRARKKLEIYGADNVVLKTVEQQGGRLSGIIDRMSDDFFFL